LQTHGQEYFLEWVGVPLHLVLFGAGHDAIPVVAMARQLGWQVTVADGRSSFARPDRFPGARCMVTGGEGAQLDTDLVDRDTAVVLMTHNYPRDLRLLEQLVPMEPRYLGILGPRDRADRLLADLRDNRIPGTGGAAFREALHAPVGLDLGAETPEAIALSIIAEVQSVFSGRDGSALRTRQGAIHTPPSERVRS
jgi:xanthine/CO dehydrogenase XdhC/CoxF family maturation factor